MTIKLIAQIKNNITSEIRDCDAGVCEPDNIPEFYWSEGNMSCDCNRRTAFDAEYDGENPCGEGEYSVILKNAQTSEIYYKEF